MTDDPHRFYKMSGSGNDFVMVDGRESPLRTWNAQRIQSVCARRTGVGADGLVVLEPGPAPGSVRFNFYNSDGGRSDMCGNASLCATRLAARIGLAPPEGMDLVTDVGTFRSRCLDEPGERAEITLQSVDGLREVAEIAHQVEESDIFLATVGVPHLVVLVPSVDLPAVSPEGRGQELRSHRALPDGANVNFVAPQGDLWRMRTFERGVEAETLACGTGAVACAAVLVRLGRADLPIDILTSSGRVLSVTGTAGPSDAEPLINPRLAGEGRLVFEGRLAQHQA